MEQLLNFVKINLLHSSNESIFFLVINGFPFFFPSSFRIFEFRKSGTKKNFKYFYKLIEEGFMISKIAEETEKIKNFHKNQNFFISLNLVFYIVYNLSKKLKFKWANIFGIISNKFSGMNQKNFKESLHVCRRLNCIFSFIIFKKNNPFLRFLTYFSNGFCSEPKENITEMIHCNKLFQVLLNSFWVNKFYKELVFKALRIKPKVFGNEPGLNCNIMYCGFCRNLFRYAFSVCVLCGKKYIDGLN